MDSIFTVSIIVLAFIGFTTSQNNDTLLVYGQPYFTADDGFVTLTANGGWDSAASGFAIQSGGADLIYGLSVSSSLGILYGSFSVWNGYYTGGLLRVGISQIEISTEGKGIIGNSVDDVAILDSSSQIAILGEFFAFSQNPSQTVQSVGVCDSSGSNCYQLGTSGLTTYAGSGRLLYSSSNGYLYALYETSSSCVISSYFIGNDDPSLDWNQIYSQSKSLTQNSCEFFKMVNYQNTLYLIGNLYGTMSYTNKYWTTITGIASWDGTQWTALGPLPNNADSIGYFDADASSNYIFLVTPTVNYQTVYSWTAQDPTAPWTKVSSTNCPLLGYPIISAVSDNSVVIKCNSSLVQITNSTQLSLALSCPQYIDDFELLSDDATLLTVCGVNSTFVRVDEFSLATNTSTSSELVSNLGSIQVQAYALCSYGERVFIAGLFDTVDTVSTQNAATFDGKQWWPMQFAETTRCACSSWGSNIAIACNDDANKNNDFLLMTGQDTGSVTSAAKLYTTYTAPYGNVQSVTALAVSSDRSTIYIAGSNNQSQISLFQWSQQTGFASLANMTGDSVQALLAYNGTLYLGGEFKFRGYINFALLELSTGNFLQADQIQNTDANDLSAVLALALVNDLLYVGGSFNNAGTLSYVNNIVACALNGTCIDNLGGGVPQNEWVVALSPIGSKIYLLESSLDCSELYSQDCGQLLYYDITENGFGFPIRDGVGMIAPSSSKKSDNSSSNSTSIFATWWMILIISIAASIAFAGIGLGAYALYRYRQQVIRRQEYQEIQNMSGENSKTNSTAIAHLTNESGIDFQHEEFELKNVLGRGSFGTVWSCVFPNRNGASYAVKQMLISRGDVQSIEMVENEILTLAKLRHEHIVHFVGYKKSEQRTSVEFFIFMELFEKPCSLRGVIDKRIKRSTKSATGRLEWFNYADVKKFMCEIADGLNYLHSNGIAHRDLKCANILVRTKTPTVVRSLHITDFGISTTAGGGATLASTITGTPAFMAPEVAKGGKYDAFKADIWSFGIVLFEILTFKEPEIPGVRPAFPPERDLTHDKQFESIVAIMTLCTEEDPDKRPSASELFHMSEVL